MACGVSFYWKIRQEIRWGCQKNFLVQPYPPSIPFALFVIGAQKLALCLVDLELCGQLGLLPGLKIDEIDGPSHMKLNFLCWLYSKRSLKWPLQNEGVQYRHGYNSLEAPWTPIFLSLVIYGITIPYRIHNKMVRAVFSASHLGWFVHHRAVSWECKHNTPHRHKLPFSNYRIITRPVNTWSLDKINQYALEVKLLFVPIVFWIHSSCKMHFFWT